MLVHYTLIAIYLIHENKRSIMNCAKSISNFYSAFYNYLKIEHISLPLTHGITFLKNLGWLLVGLLELKTWL